MAVGKRLKNIVFYLQNYEKYKVHNFVITKKELPLVNYKWNNVVINVSKYNRFISHIYLFVYIYNLRSESKLLYYYGLPNVFNFWVFILIRKLGCKVVFDVVEDYSTFKQYSSFLNRLSTKLVVYFNNNIHLFCDGVIVISTYLERKYKEKYLNQFPVFLLPISVLKSDYDTLEYPLKTDQINVFYGGSFAYKDGVFDLISAFSKVHSQFNNLNLVLTGEPGNENDNKRLSEALLKYKGTNIQYLGFVTDDEYFRLIKTSHILCMPRKNISFAKAGFPFKIGEFMMTGNAVLASRIPEVEALISDNEICYYNPDEFDDLVNKLTLLVGNKYLRESFGKNSQIKAFSLFESEQYISKLMGFIDSLTTK